MYLCITINAGRKLYVHYKLLDYFYSYFFSLFWEIVTNTEESLMKKLLCSIFLFGSSSCTKYFCVFDVVRLKWLCAIVNVLMSVYSTFVCLLIYCFWRCFKKVFSIKLFSVNNLFYFFSTTKIFSLNY